MNVVNLVILQESVVRELWGSGGGRCRSPSLRRRKSPSYERQSYSPRERRSPTPTRRSISPRGGRNYSRSLPSYCGDSPYANGVQVGGAVISVEPQEDTSSSMYLANCDEKS